MTELIVLRSADEKSLIAEMNRVGVIPDVEG